ncbi:tRNA-uridine aminocarboxypropyltransferase [Massilia sp. DWR3-1-1]|uniref:tRNA-uridine aminocarboxypropyltransferase n=1 Tax=Massilia sp. DWR3-1-1 TaxID=2804559 RepID=UPI003CF591C3
MSIDCTRRAVCPTCLRPQTTCICRWIAAQAFDTSLLILQHPLEVRNAKGSARLLHLCVPGSVMLTGEAFDRTVLAAHLGADGRTPLLLYPQEPGAPADPVQPDPGRGAAAGRRLVVLDGTWRKSRKMLHLNPLLATLPRLALRQMPASHYRIRKAHAPDQLSSFEAAAYALSALQGDDAGPARLQGLLRAFDGFVDQQAAYAKIS